MLGRACFEQKLSVAWAFLNIEKTHIRLPWNPRIAAVIIRTIAKPLASGILNPASCAQRPAPMPPAPCPLLLPKGPLSTDNAAGRCVDSFKECWEEQEEELQQRIGMGGGSAAWAVASWMQILIAQILCRTTRLRICMYARAKRSKYVYVWTLSYFTILNAEITARVFSFQCIYFAQLTFVAYKSNLFATLFTFTLTLAWNLFVCVFNLSAANIFDWFCFFFIFFYLYPRYTCTAWRTNICFISREWVFGRSGMEVWELY